MTVLGRSRLAPKGLDPHILAMLTEAEEAGFRTGAAASPPARVAVARLVLTDFRNYRGARLDLGPQPVVLTGPNGAGKTNLLEAVSFLAPGRGLRRARLGEIDRRDAAPPSGAPSSGAPSSGWAVAATVATSRGSVRIGTGRDSNEGDKRVLRIDGERARSQATLGEHFGVLWLTPSMDRLFVEGRSERRRFLDRLVLALDPAHAARVAGYEQALRERARLLRDSFHFSRPADPAWLAALEAAMAAEGVAVAAARAYAVELLDQACNEVRAPFPRVRLRLGGTLEAWLEAMPALAAEAKFAAALVAGRRGDGEAGGAAIGPHRSDFAVTLADKGIDAALASTGEQKAALIAILLAHASLLRRTRGAPPLLLLDEIAAHLDEQRRAALFAALEESQSQAWLTGTDTALFAPLRGGAQLLAVRDGTVALTDFDP
ncbi:MAG: DNA replication/repair protein RecF [Stellaceae bacterium]